jgi:hypothetical protein
MERRRRTARIAAMLACAAVPVVLLAGCSSSGSGSGSGSGGGSSAGASSSASSGGKDSAVSSSGTTTSATPAPAPAKYAKLPDACKSLTKETVSALVPKVKHAGGSRAAGSDTVTRGGCSWTGNGTDGYQYRWLSVSFQRFTASPGLGSPEEQAQSNYADQVSEAGRAIPGSTTGVADGIGDQASSVGGKATVAKVTSQNDSVVARTGNVVVLVEFNGAGLEGKKNPTSTTVANGALRAAKDAVAAVAAANS